MKHFSIIVFVFYLKTVTGNQGELVIHCDSPFDEVITPGTRIISPNHPGDYENNKDCQVTIRFSGGVRIRFEAFNIELSKSCAYDYIEVRDGDSANSNLIGSRLCGTTIPDPIESSGSSLTLIFHTDVNTVGTGFKIITEEENCIVDGHILQGNPVYSGIGYSTFKEAKFECSKGRACSGITFESDTQKWTPMRGADLIVSANPKDKSILRSCYDCLDGDVKIDEDGIPMIYWKSSWAPICGHYFWNNQIGANKFCNKMGYDHGLISGNEEREFYESDAFKLGQCKSDDAWLRCSGGCNDNNIGGHCQDDVNTNCSAGQPVKLNITCKGNSSKTTSCKGACASHSCKNNGFCTNDRGRPKCVCIDGYQGDYCEKVEITVIETCDDTYNKTTREISYSRTNNSNETTKNCSWRITVPDDRNVIVDIIDLQIEPSRNCKSSSLEVFDGSDDRSAMIGEKMCGSQTNSIIESSGNELYLKYSSTASSIHNDQFSIKCIISDYLIIDGDMMIYEENEFGDDGHELSEGIVDEKFLWPLDSATGTVPIPFMIQDNIRREIRERIIQAVSEYSNKTCIRFTEQSTAPNDLYVYFKDSNGCQSAVGRKPYKYNKNQHLIRTGGCKSTGSVVHELMHTIGFFHEIMRLDRDTYVDVDFDAIKEYEIALYGRVTNRMKNQNLRCDQHTIGKSRGCQTNLRSKFDGDSIMMYPPTLTAPVLVNGQTVDKNFTIYTLKASAHKLCEGGKCHPGQRDGLSRTDITDIKALYGTTCDLCKLKDDDVCLQTSPSWDSSYTCMNSKKYCTKWAKDMRRCCPISCNTGDFTYVDCLGSSGKGTCRYPNDAQCDLQGLRDHLLVIGGYDGRWLSEVEMISLGTQDQVCQPLQLEYPVVDHSSVVTSRGVITCGGSNGTGLKTCTLQTKEGETKPFPSMIRSRYGFGMVVMDQSLIVVGGVGASDKMEKIGLIDNEWVEEDLPFTVWGHCVVSINKTTMMAIGGLEGWNRLDTTWIFDSSKNQWTKGPALREKRSYHSCFYDAKWTTVFVIGGKDENLKRLKSTEKLKMNEQLSWESTTDLPEPLSYSAAVASNSNVFIGYVAGGYTNNTRTDKIWGLRRTDLNWVEMPKRLQKTRYSHTMVNIASDEIPGC